MNLAKKRKLTAIITLSVMLVAVVATACILTVPGLYKDEDLTPTSTDNYTGIYGSAAASYNASNTKLAFGKQDEGDMRVLFPQKIYIDKNETLQQAGYYFAYDVYTSHKYNGRIFMMDNIMGYYPGVDDQGKTCLMPDTGSAAYTMHNVFDGYGRVSTESINSANVTTGAGEVTTRNTCVIIETKKENKSAKVWLKGSVKNKDSLNILTNGAVTDTYLSQKNVTLGILQYEDTNIFSKGWKNCGSPEISNFQSGTGNFTGIAEVAGASYVNDQIKIDIYIYDKSALNTAITDFKTELNKNTSLSTYSKANSFIQNIENKYLKAREVEQVNINDATNYVKRYLELYKKANAFLTTINGNKTLLNTINGNDDAFNRASTFINNIVNNNLNYTGDSWTITDQQVTNAVNDINNYVIELTRPTEAKENSTYSSASAVDMTELRGRYSSDYFDMEVRNSAGSPVAEVKDADTYTVYVRPKTTYEVGGMKICWTGNTAADKNNDYVKSLTWTVDKKSFTATPQDRQLSFKNSDYVIDIGSVSYSGFEGDDINPKTILLSKDNGATWSETVSIGGSASDIGSTNNIRFKISAPNHNEATGSFGVTVVKANITLPVTLFDQDYGSAILDSEGIIDNIILPNMTELLDATDKDGIKNYLQQIIKRFVAGTLANPLTIVGNNYIDVGRYPIAFERNEEWNDRIGTIQFINDTYETAYHINQKEVEINWDNLSSIYDGLAKRPTATLSSTSGNVLEGTATSLVVDLLPGGGVNSKGNVAYDAEGNAVHAATYQAKVTCTNANYKVKAGKETVSFTINPRPIAVKLQDRNRTYAQSNTASEVWNTYITQLFPNNIDTEGKVIYVLTSGVSGESAIVSNDLVPDIFTIEMLNAAYTGDYYTVGEYDLTIKMLYKNNYVDYEITNLADSGAKFTVSPATIEIDLQQINSHIYNGAEQKLELPTTVINLKGNEAITWEGVEIKYLQEDGVTYSTEAPKMKNIGTKDIHYQVTAPNHNPSQGHFAASITPVQVYVDVENGGSVINPSAKYGDDIPDSDTLIAKLGIKFYSDLNKSALNETLNNNIRNEVDFHLFTGTSGNETIVQNTRDAQVGSYTVAREFKANGADSADIIAQNYVIRYYQNEGGHKNVGAYVVGKRPLYVDWTQSGGNWFDGDKYTFDGTAPTVYPQAPALWNDEVNVVDGDTISFKSDQLSGSKVGIYEFATQLTNERNIRNYELKNNIKEFEIVKLTIQIMIKHFEATYGSAQTVSFGVLTSPVSTNPTWAYADGSAKFFGDDYLSFTLVSDAHSADGSLVDVGNYPVDIKAIASANPDVVGNYDFEIVKTDAMDATFKIKAAKIQYLRRQFNIDISPNSGENGWVEMGQIQAGISTVANTDREEFSIEMTDLFQGDKAIDSSDLTWVTTKTRTIDDSAIGNYFIWVKITHRNYEEFTAKLEANFFTKWISMIIGEGITNAEYGNTIHDSARLFDELNFAAIYGIVDEENNNENKPLAEALAELKTYIDLFVGSGDTMNPMEGTNAFGTYSIYFKAKPTTSSDLHFRFLPYNGGEQTSNVGAYKVVERTVEMDWGTMDEIYGDHGNSHNYKVGNPVGTDEVDVEVIYYQKVNGIWEELKGVHAKNVGEYRAEVIKVLHPSYKLPDGSALQYEFRIEPKEMTIKLADRTVDDNDKLTYGADLATTQRINEYLNNASSGRQLYSIVGGDEFVEGDTVSNIFALKIGDYVLEEGLTYLKAGDYVIDGEMLASGYNYNLTFQTGSFTIGKANALYQREQIQSKSYTGEGISVAPERVFDYITLQGDGQYFKDNNLVKVEYKQTSESDDKYSEKYEVVNAKKDDYIINIKITAPNHNVYEGELRFRVTQASVIISMTQTSKVYGDDEQKLCELDGEVNNFSDWLKKHCNITMTIDGKPADRVVKNIYSDIAFKVIKKGQGNGDALEVGANDIGEYRVYFDVDNSKNIDNYSIDFAPAPGTDPSSDKDELKCNYNAYLITPRPVDIVWSTSGYIDGIENKFEYTGIAPTITAAFQQVNVTGMTAIRVDLSSNPTGVGSYSASAIIDSSMAMNEYMKNYDFGNKTFDYTIVAKHVVITIANQQATYGSNEAKSSAKLRVEYTSDDAHLINPSIELSLEGVDTDRDYYLPAAQYHIVGSSDNKNYDYEFVGDGSAESYAIFTVNPADITLYSHTHEGFYNGQDFVADVKTNFKKESSEGNKLYVLAGDMSWDDIEVLYSLDNGSTYTSEVPPVIEGVTPQNGVDVYFMIKLANHNDKRDTVTIKINPPQIHINVSKGASSVYGDDILESDDLFVKAGIEFDEAASDIKGVDIKSLLTFKVDTANVANQDRPDADLYDIVYEFINSENASRYTIVLHGNGDAYEVEQLELAVDWDYSQAFEYDKQEHTVTATLNGLLSGDSANAVCEGNSGVDAAEYTARVTSVDNSNYKLGASAVLTWKINPKGIEVEWTDGDFTYDGSEHILDAPVIVSGLIDGDVSDITVEGNKINAGIHTATAKATNGNYFVVNATYEFEIKQAPVQISWKDTQLVYNGQEQVIEAEVVSGIVGNDDCSVNVSGAQKNAGKNYIATATLDNPNYKIANDSTKTFEIKAKAITFTWDETPLAYTGEKQAPKAVAVGAVAGDIVEFEIAGEEINAGNNYTATVTGVKNSNYIVDEVNQISMSTTYSIAKGVNTFNSELSLPSTVDKMPWIGEDKPQAKWGEVVVKYYSDEACTNEVTDIENAGEGTYWIKAFVAGTDNYDELVSQTFKVELQGGLNIAIVVVGAVLSVALLAGAFAVVKVTNKKKKQQGGAV